MQVVFLVCFVCDFGLVWGFVFFRLLFLASVWFKQNASSSVFNPLFFVLQAPAYSVLKTAIQLGCKAAIFLSERI